MPDRHWLPRRYESRERPAYDDDPDDGVTWQPDVYRTAAAIAGALGAVRVIDVGCGRGAKLAALYPKLEVVGIDYGPNIEHCRAAYPFGTWIEHDLEQSARPPLPDEQLGDAVIVCADVIEHLVNPTFLLETLAAWVPRSRAVLLSTPERELWAGVRHSGPPRNPCHVREWSMRELGQLLRATGMPYHSLGLTRSNDRTEELHTILAIIASKPEALDDIVATAVDLEPPKRRHSAPWVRLARLARIAIRG